MRLVIAGIVAVVIVVVYAQVASNKVDPNTLECLGAEERDAKLISKEFVKRELKAPATSQFPNTWEEGAWTVKRSGCTFTVSSYVDAENGFGALIRSRYRVEVHPVSDPRGVAWEAASVEFN